MAHTLIRTPIGPLFIAASDRGLRRLDFVEGVRSDMPAESEEHGLEGNEVLDEARRQIEEYFAGTRRDFDLPLDLAGTEFQRRVWRSIAAIPFGQTLSYAELAMAAGAPNAYRAAGTACGANPVAIIVPCHRVVGSDRGLHGFGGGLDVKVWLLRHEGALAGVKAEAWANEPRRRQPALI
jgi:methylated-DNA-[protein]-cysteine S-methyltransferase